VRSATSVNVPSAALAAAGLGALVYGFDRTATAGWGNPLAIGFLAAGVALLAAFAFLQRKLAHPLLPLRVPGNRSRGAALIVVGLSTIAMFSVFLFLVYYMQQVLGFTPLASGTAFIPILGGMALGAAITSSRPFARTPPRAIFLASGFIGGAGMLLLTRLTPHSGYWADIVPGMIVTGVRIGLATAISTNLATANVLPEDSGVASAFLNSTQQIGGALGIAILSTVASRATTRSLAAHRGSSPTGLLDATVHGYTTAFLVSAIILAATGVLTAALMPGRRAPAMSQPTWPCPAT